MVAEGHMITGLTFGNEILLMYFSHAVVAEMMSRQNHLIVFPLIVNP
jgi:hypothetical protein